jgi:hypothetical protein
MVALHYAPPRFLTLRCPQNGRLRPHLIAQPRNPHLRHHLLRPFSFSIL